MCLQGAAAPRGWAFPCGRASGALWIPGAAPGRVESTALRPGPCPLPADGRHDACSLSLSDSAFREACPRPGSGGDRPQG